MNRSKLLADRFREVMLNGKWIANTNFKEQISDLNWQQATRKIGSLNTIALLTFHINYYIAGVLNVFEGGDLEIRDKYSFDMPPIESQEAWQQLMSSMWENSEKFAVHVEAMSDAQLDEVFVKENYGTYLRNVDAMIEHAYYHFGQVSLIKKMVLEADEKA